MDEQWGQASGEVRVEVPPVEDCAAHLPYDLFAIGQKQARPSAKDTAKERGAVSGAIMLARDESIKWERL